MNSFILNRHLAAFCIFWAFCVFYSYSAWNEIVFGVAGLGVSIVVGVVYLAYAGQRFSVFYVNFFVLFFCFLLVVSANSVNSIYVLAQYFFSVLCFFVFSVLFRNNYKLIRLVCYYALVMLTSFLLFWYINDFVFFKPWVFVGLNPNVLGFVCFLALFFLIIGFIDSSSVFARFVFGLFVFVDLFLLYLSGARSSLLAFLVAIGFWFLFSVLKLRVAFFITTILLIFVLSPVFSYNYVDFVSAGGGDAKNAEVFELTGKAIFTGREQIWALIFSDFFKHPLLGRGVGFELSNIGVDVSSHNLYLTILVQTGVVGYSIFILWFYLMLRQVLIGNRSFIFSSRSTLAWSWVLATLIQQNFEQFLFQNNMAASLLFWVILAVSFDYKFALVRRT